MVGQFLVQSFGDVETLAQQRILAHKPRIPKPQLSDGLVRLGFDAIYGTKGPQRLGHFVQQIAHQSFTASRKCFLIKHRNAESGICSSE